jgi:hypothetical protein
MDKFNKIAIILLIAAVTAIVIMSYVSYYYVDHAPSQLPSTDSSVNTKAGSNGTTYYNPFTIEHWGNTGENIGFTIVGCVGGLIGGYIYPTIFSKSQKAGKEQKTVALSILPAFLTGDPLNGIGTIAGFFICAMIGRKIKLRQMKQKAN